MAKNPMDILRDYLDMPNIAEELKEGRLHEIARLVKSGYDIDEASRADWKKQTEEGIKIAEQLREEKSYPWPNAANVKYPLIAISAIQFAARAYPSIIQGDKVVKATVVGKDPDNRKAEKARRVSTHMSWQLLEKMEGWDEDTDKLLHALPVVGTLFRKTYYDDLNQVNASELCMPLDVVIHMKTKNLARCRRISHRIMLYKNEVLERERSGLFLDKAADYMQQHSEEDLAECFIEQHRWLDLDDDGYEEPYIVTIHETSGELVRIVACFDEDGIELNGKGKIRKIRPVQYFTPYYFIPSPSGNFYALGFAHLLGGINETLSTIINQLLDAGHLATVQGGFLGRGARMKGGAFRFSPGEWKVVDVPGGQLKDNIVPLPVKEPSNVLFQLLGLLNESGMKLASVSDTMAGETPSQNTPATTTLAVIEQGLKVFTAIYKRVFRSLKSEFAKLRRLNSLYLDEEEAFRVSDEEHVAFRDDYSLQDYDVVPVADPTLASDAQRLAKAQALLGTMEMNPTPDGKLEILSQFYEALQVPNMEKLLPKDEQGKIIMPEPPADPKALELQLKAVQAQNEDARKWQEFPVQLKKLEAQIDEIKARTTNYLAQAQDKPIQTALATLNAQVAAMQNETKMEIERLKAAQKQEAAGGDAGRTAQDRPAGDGGVALPPDDGQGADVLGGVQAVSAEPAVPGSNPVAEQLGPDGLADGAAAGGDQGSRPYPPDVRRS